MVISGRPLCIGAKPLASRRDRDRGPRLVERWGLPVALLAGEGNGRLRSSVRAPEVLLMLLCRLAGICWSALVVTRPPVDSLCKPPRWRPCRAADWLGQRVVGGPRSCPGVCQTPAAGADQPGVSQRCAGEPFGAANPSPLFWARHCGSNVNACFVAAISYWSLRFPVVHSAPLAWRWSGPEPTSQTLDLAFRLKEPL